jgi:hypothetical protein
MKVKPLAIDLFAGLGGWAEGLLAEGWDVTGYDIEAHEYGDQKYPGKLILQDVLTIHGSQFKDADLIVASPPCQEYSYMAMPWSRAKAIQADYLSGKRDRKKLTALFDACFRIQREASEAAVHHIPMVIENVRGAQKWVGRSRCNFGSYHLWGDVPALMPIPAKGQKKTDLPPVPVGKLFRETGQRVSRMTTGHIEGRGEGTKNDGGSWFNVGSPGQKETNKNPVHAMTGFKSQGMNWSDQMKKGQDFTRLAGQHCGLKGSNGYERDHPQAFGWKKPGTSSKSSARKAASAMIAKIPFPLSQWIARIMKPNCITVSQTKTKERQNKMSKKKQAELKGIEAPSFPAVESAAESYIDIRDKRMALTEKEVDARAVLIHEMQKEKLQVYKFNDQIVTLLPGKEKVRVKTVTDDDTIEIEETE